MKVISYILTVVFFISTLSLAQGSPDAAQKEAMKKFDWLVGEWLGTAVIQMGPSKTDTVNMVETITKKLDGTSIFVEGTGYKKGEVVHNAFAIISYDDRTSKYRWHSWRVPGGLFNEHEPVITEAGFTWSMETPRGKMKYTITNDNGAWFEIGEFSADGKQWTKFIEMKLTRKRDAGL